IFTREEVEHGVLPEQFVPAIRVRAAKAGAEKPSHRSLLGSKVARRVARRTLWIRQPKTLIVGSNAHGHDSRAIFALEQGAQLCDAALQFQQELWPLRRELEIVQREVRFHRTAGAQSGPGL